MFRVTMDDHPETYYEGNSPTSPWNLILKKVLELRTENPRALSVSGPEYYGLAAPITIYLIQKMEGADKCVNYVMRQFAPPGIKKPSEPKPTRAPSHSQQIEPEKPKPVPPPPAPLPPMPPRGFVQPVATFSVPSPVGIGSPTSQLEMLRLLHEMGNPMGLMEAQAILMRQGQTSPDQQQLMIAQMMQNPQNMMQNPQMVQYVHGQLPKQGPR
jgi:hypothetical protein